MLSGIGLILPDGRGTDVEFFEQITIVAGDPGSGKSTLLSQLAQETSFQSRLVDGACPALRPEHVVPESLAYLQQLFPDLTTTHLNCLYLSWGQQRALLFIQATIELANTPRRNALTPKILLWEHPEAGLGQKQLRALVGLLMPLIVSAELQLVVTTHSTEVVKVLSDLTDTGMIKPGDLALIYLRAGDDLEADYYGADIISTYAFWNVPLDQWNPGEI